MAVGYTPPAMTRLIPRPLLYAHRGAAHEQPENTMPSFQRAMEIGVDALETDLHMTMDGHIVLSHDPSAGRMTGVKAEFRAATLTEVKGWDAGFGFQDPDGHRPFAGKGIRVPTLAELLDEFSDVQLNVDIKQASPPMVSALLTLLRKTDSAERVTIGSFHGAVIRDVRRRQYPGSTALSMAEMMSFVGLPAFGFKGLWRALGGTGDAAQIPTHWNRVRLDTRDRVARLHDLGIRVDYWTINDPGEARRLLDLGADGIMTDDPGAIKPVFDDMFPAR